MHLFKLFGVIDVRFADILDIFLISIIAYYVFLLFRGTRAVQMFVGGGLLLIGWILAQWWELHTLVWLLSNLATLGIIAIVILFQPEIRGALTRIGQSAAKMNLKNPNIFGLYFVIQMIWILGFWEMSYVRNYGVPNILS